MMDVALLQPGDILAVNTHSFWGRFIRLAAWLRGQDSKHDHIVIVYGYDPLTHGVLKGIEARPGGVGWVDILQEYDHTFFVANVGQSRTDTQRKFITEHAKLLLGTPYDWQAIIIAGADVVGGPKWIAAKVLLERYRLINADVPTKMMHIMCASFAVWLNHHAPAPQLTYPDQHGESWTTPADWVDWMKETGFDRPLGSMI